MPKKHARMQKKNEMQFISSKKCSLVPIRCVMSCNNLCDNFGNFEYSDV